MRLVRILCIYLFLFFHSLFAYTYLPNVYVSQQVWEELLPYFLPEDHPVKSKLDKIFSEDRVITSEISLKKAGFHTVVKPRQGHALILKHKDIKSYLFKVFPDDAPFTEEWRNWKKRIIGANLTRDAIIRNGFEDVFKVPKKWIYPLPLKYTESGSYPKFFILVTEKIHLVKYETNFLQWKSISVTPPFLSALYKILEEVGLNDSIYPTNIPFTKEGKIAFIDTEHWNHWPVDYHKLDPYLTSSMRKRWNKITQGL